MLNLKDVRKSVAQEAEKRFNFNENDWGFREFMPVATLFDPEKGFYVNDTIIVECVIHVCKEPFLVNPQSYDSKKETGFVGVKNQGATCYMNSLLQTWYHITFLRKAVYKMPIEENESPTESIPLALQRVFYALQTENNAIDTKELTKSFGWDTIDSFLQHDVQELARVLSDNLEKKMDKTPSKGIMKYLFEGVIKNYIKCINVNYESSRNETFYDLQLNVKGCKNVYDSFKDYIAEETLEGDNQYHAEGFGKQDAKKGCIFIKFPPVLTLHLKRFEYDVMRDAMYKV
jgi:ubiquitin carboxyl-terminal hydrolase 7